MKVLIVFGTRPEAIKMCPLVIELKRNPKFQVVVCVTGQHRRMLDQVLELFNVVPEYDLEIMKQGQTLFDITEAVLGGVRNCISKEKPDIVLVHGDTTTSFAAALAAFYMQVPVGHVEAGLRTYDIRSPYPEEFNRSSIGIISDYNFAPTKRAMENLLRENKKPSGIWITGNTGIDALKYTVKSDYWHKELEWAKGYRMILITAHRRENLGEPMRNMFRAIKRDLDEHDDIRAIYPIHLNPAVRNIATEVFGKDNSYDKLHIIEPLDVMDFHNFIKASHLVLTDSGGIQEEAPSLGKPVLVMRDTTERPEGIEAGTLKLVGTEEETIYREFTLLLTDNNEYEKMAHSSNPYGDGHASEKIAAILERIERMNNG